MEKQAPPPYVPTPGNSAPKRPWTAPRPVTYTLAYTSKAARSFSLDLPNRLVAAHRSFDPSMPSSSIRVISNFLANSYGNWFFAGGSGGDSQDYRYVRVVVEIPVEDGGGLSKESKQELMVLIVSAVQAYEGKKARETEIDVVVREVRGEDEMWVGS